MCGIFGIVTDGRELPVAVGEARAALLTLAHRGPDGRGEHVTPTAYLGHQRLAIIDLAGGEQPMVTGDGRYVVTFNGQIYNYRELRPQLEVAGYRFRTSSDTEVLLAAYATWGEDCLRRLRGMFAFAILDQETGELFAARDRFGIKPFFYAEHEGVLAFGSELKSIRRLGHFRLEPDERHFNEYLIFGYVAGAETLLRGALELQPGHALRFTLDGVSTRRYATPWEFDPAAAELSEAAAAAALEGHLERAVELWTRGDVEVTSLLSGGLDSPLASSLAADNVPGLRTFSAVFPSDPAIDESATVAELAQELGVGLVMIPIEDDYLERHLLPLVGHFDEPLHDSNYFTLLALCDGIRQRTDVKVVLCGEGADELFAGYARYASVPEEFARTGDPDTLVYARNTVALPRLRLFTDDVSIANPVRHELLEEIRGTVPGRDPLNALLMLDQATFLGSYLHRQDRVGMRHGLEIRVPYLDHELARFANGLSPSFKLRDGVHKWLLRRVAERRLPHEIVWRREKIALSSSLNRLLDEGLEARFRDVLGAGAILSDRYSVDGIGQLLDDHRPAETGRDHSNTLWRLFSLELWLQSLPSTPAAAPA